MQTAAKDRPGGPVDDRAAVASDPCSEAWERYASGDEFKHAMLALKNPGDPVIRRHLFLAFIAGYVAR